MSVRKCCFAAFDDQGDRRVRQIYMAISFVGTYKAEACVCGCFSVNSAGSKACSAPGGDLSPG